MAASGSAVRRAPQARGQSPPAPPPTGRWTTVGGGPRSTSPRIIRALMAAVAGTVPHRFNGQPMLLSHNLPGSMGYQAQAMETLERFGSRVRGGAEMRLQDMDWAMIVDTSLARLRTGPRTARVPPPRPQRTRLTAEIGVSRHRIPRAPPTLAEAREYMAEVAGIEAPQDHQQPFGAWAMDCFITEANVRAGGKATVQYIASSTACTDASQWRPPALQPLPTEPPADMGTWTSATPTTSESETCSSPLPGCGSSSTSATGFSISCA